MGVGSLARTARTDHGVTFVGDLLGIEEDPGITVRWNGGIRMRKLLETLKTGSFLGETGMLDVTSLAAHL